MAKIERTKNASRNITFGILLKLYQVVVPFLMRTAMIYLMGIQYLGLSGLFTSVLQVLNLAELGVGSAMVYSMYKPIAEDDEVSICALMKLYRTYYRIIGIVIAFIGCFLTPFIPSLIRGNVPKDINVYLLYLLNLCITVISYWLFAYKNSILLAHQRTDIVSKITIVTNTIQFILQFSVLWFLRNYYAYIIVALLGQILTNITTAMIADKYYPNYKPLGDLAEDKRIAINNRIKDLFTSKIGAIIVNSVDTIVVSAFLGLTMLAIYQNYFFVISSVIGFVSIVFSSCTAGIGNSLIVETKQKNYCDLNRFTFIIAWIAGVCSCCLLNLYQPFMEIWVGNKLMLDYSAVICLAAYFFIYEINQLLNLYKDAGGIWHEDRFRPLITGVVNLGMNLVMVRFWGINGVLLSTVFSMLFVGMPWLFHNLFTTIFEKKYLIGYLKRMAIYVAVSILVCLVSTFVCCFINIGVWGTLIVRGIICVLISNGVFLLCYKTTNEYHDALMLINTITNGRLDRFFKVVK